MGGSLGNVELERQNEVRKWREKELTIAFSLGVSVLSSLSLSFPPPSLFFWGRGGGLAYGREEG